MEGCGAASALAPEVGDTIQGWQTGSELMNDQNLSNHLRA